MARLVLIMGKSGSGKSASLRNFPMDKYSLFNVMGKDLPFKSTKKFVATTEYAALKNGLMQASAVAEREAIVIDDAGYLITEQFMRNHSTQSKGNEIFALYNSIADQFYTLLRFIKNELPQDKIVYMTMHEEVDEFGNVKPKTIGKMLDEKVNVAGLFTIILHAVKSEGKYLFKTQSDGYDVTKSPMGMFDAEFVDNDLFEVHNRIKAYYNTEEKVNE